MGLDTRLRGTRPPNVSPYSQALEEMLFAVPFTAVCKLALAGRRGLDPGVLALPDLPAGAVWRLTSATASMKAPGTSGATALRVVYCDQVAATLTVSAGADGVVEGELGGVAINGRSELALEWAGTAKDAEGPLELRIRFEIDFQRDIYRPASASR